MNMNHQPHQSSARTAATAQKQAPSQAVRGSTSKPNPYKRVADAILAKLKTCQPWERPWCNGGVLRMPINATTGRAYRGMNVPMLWVAGNDADYDDHRWATFRQWQQIGAVVRKGEHGTPIVWFRMLEPRDAEDTDDGSRLIPCARVSMVFCATQVDGVELEPLPTKPTQVQAVATADALIQRSGANVVNGGTKAYYQPGTDTIHVPARESFRRTDSSTATEGYYATLLHELTHWTGPRLQRAFGHFGDQAYAAEELVAELGAAFLCAECGISNEPREDHAAYIRSWIELLQDNPRAFATAAGKAAQAADFLRGA